MAVGNFASLGAGLLGQQTASAPYGFSLQAANAANSVQFPLNLNPSGGDVAIGANLVVSTSGKGIDFSATPGTGTSELFADYEEGTFTPTITSGVGSITTLGTVNGQYTKIGNKYIVNINAGITVNGLGSGYIIMAGLPTAGNGTQLIGSGNENAVTGKALTISSDLPGASGANLRVCLIYQA
jgi:hypothetical protein